MYYLQSIEILDRIGDKHNAAIYHGNAGVAYMMLDDAEEAINHMEKAKALFQMVGASDEANRVMRQLQDL